MPAALDASDGPSDPLSSAAGDDPLATKSLGPGTDTSAGDPLTSKPVGDAEGDAEGNAEGDAGVPDLSGGDDAGNPSGDAAAMPASMAAALDAVEADAVFCFTHLMAETRDHFCSKLDHTELGITAKITRMEKLIEAKDPELGRALKRLRVVPTFYGFRWITLLLTQEWDLPDVLRLWDSLLADPNRLDFLLYFCVAMVVSIRGELLEQNDFAFAVKALQRFDGRVPLHSLLRRAHSMYSEDGRE